MIKLLEFELLHGRPEIGNFISTRRGGVSKGNFQSLNLSLKSGDLLEYVIQNRSILAKEIGLQPDHLLFPDQCHTNRVKIVSKEDSHRDLAETDALVTDQAGIGLCILAADCVPVLLFDPVRKVVAAMHAGWKGTVRQIVTTTIGQMKNSFGSDPCNILAGIGPAISQKKYEVGDEVTAQFRTLFNDHPEIIWRNPQTGSDHLDLQEANRILLLESGISTKNIEVMRICTWSNPDLFFSARRDGFNCGRFATGIMLIP
jgi:YfiH family protein